MGFGGSCFPKDLRAAVATGREAGVRLELLEAVVAVNERQKRLMGEKVLAHFGGTGGPRASGSRCGAWRSSPAPTTCARPRPWS